MTISLIAGKWVSLPQPSLWKYHLHHVVSLGLVAFCRAGGTQRLPRLVGKAIAKELIFTGRKVGGRAALEMGMLNNELLCSSCGLSSFCDDNEILLSPSFTWKKINLCRTCQLLCSRGWSSCKGSWSCTWNKQEGKALYYKIIAICECSINQL